MTCRHPSAGGQNRRRSRVCWEDGVSSLAHSLVVASKRLLSGRGLIVASMRLLDDGFFLEPSSRTRSKTPSKPYIAAMSLDEVHRELATVRAELDDARAGWTILLRISAVARTRVELERDQAREEEAGVRADLQFV